MTPPIESTPLIRPLDLRPYFEEFLETLEGRDRSRFQAALSQLCDMLGESIRIPNRDLLWDLPNRFRCFLREKGLEAESVKNYSHWTTRALKHAIEAHAGLVSFTGLGSGFPSLSPDADDC
jgi:hypothetical protein